METHARIDLITLKTLILERWLSKIAGDLFRASHAFTPLRTQSGLMNLWAAAFTWRGHLRLVRALEVRDREKAHALMLTHIREGRRYVSEFIKHGNNRGTSPTG